MDRKELIKKYIEFFKEKGHNQIPNASLIPENDPTVLFTTAGMHPLVPYLLGQPHPQGKRLVNVQRCIRTVDIEEVGDSYHHTFFEMLGNWSLGDYWKEDAIKMTFEFVTKSLKLPVERLAVSAFKGDLNAPKDNESVKTWKSLGFSDKKIAFLPKKENFWGPAGKTGPCGPNTEIFYWKINNQKTPEEFDPKNSNWIEIGNDVLLEYNKDEKGKYKSLKQKNIDFGGGVERTLATLNGFEDNYLTTIWQPIIKQIEKISKKKYSDYKKEFRIIADHIKASIFILAEKVTPGNTEQGYVLRRLIRRAIRYGRNLKIKNFTKDVAESVFQIYEDYPELKSNKKFILEELEKEEEKFSLTVEKGLNRFVKLTETKKELSGKDAFLLYQSFGFPIEMIQEECKKNKIKFDEKDFEKEHQKHQKLSQTASKGKFKSGLADHSEKTTRLHTAAHLLLAALRKVLKENISQKGSNINSERLRFDFTFSRKLTDKEKKEIEDLVNKQIERELTITREEMSLDQAKKSGALGAFENKYGEIVSIYTVGDFSKEICTGPHVKNTKEIGKFKIQKEESSSSGVRRIKAIVE